MDIIYLKFFKKNRLIFSFITLTCLLLANPVFSQQHITVKGRVIDETGLGLPGVTITVVEDPSTGTITDISGEFSLQVPRNSKLSFSYVGYETKILPVSVAKMEVVLQEDVKSLEEVIVIGYGFAKKSDLTGAISSVSKEILAEQPSLKVEHALQGRVPGLQIQRSGGDVANNNLRIRIRGVNSLTGDNNPLFVIDGMVGGNIGAINPADIESMEVLQDASATAIYGSRGSNGVILIKTKTGKSGKLEVNFNSNYGWDFANDRVDLLTAVPYMETLNAISRETNVGVPFTETEINQFRNGTKESTNWQDEMWKKGVRQDYNLSVSGGNDKAKYYTSVGYSNISGTKPNDKYERFTFKTNLDYHVNTRINLKFNTFAVRANSKYGDLSTGRTFPIYIWAPNLPVKDPETGDYTDLPGYGNSVYDNPIFYQNEMKNRGFVNQYNGNFDLGIKLTEGLTYNFYGAASLSNNNSNSFSRYGIGKDVTTSSIGANDSHSYTWQLNNQLTYDRIFNNHHINAVIVQEAQKEKSQSNGSSTTGLLTNSLLYYNLGIGSTPSISSGYNGSQLSSFLGRINYTFADKYLISFSIRADGSSRFAEGNKWAYYPSGAIAWKLHEENFFKSLTSIFQTFKLRASYGEVGSQAINNYQTLQSMSVGQTPIDGKTLGYNYVALGKPANPDLKWETTAQTNLGFNGSILQGKIRFDFDYYHKKTRDLLYAVTLPSYTGVPGLSQLKNIGSMENKGIAFDINSNIINTKDWGIDIGFNASHNQNKFLGLGDGSSEKIILSDQTYKSDVLQGIYPFYLEKGNALADIYGLKYLGTWKTSEAEEAAKFGYLPGDPKYLDVDGNNQYTNADAVKIGNGQPKWIMGMNIDVTYKRFDLNAFFQGAFGYEIWNIDKYMTQKFGTSPALLNRWTPEKETDEWGYNRGFLTAASSHYVEKGNYLKLRNVTLGYTLPETITKRWRISNIRAYINAQNVFTITGYSWLDPEVSASGNTDTSQGVNLGTYPIPRTVLLGVNVTF